MTPCGPSAAPTRRLTPFDCCYIFWSIFYPGEGGKRFPAVWRRRLAIIWVCAIRGHFHDPLQSISGPNASPRAGCLLFDVFLVFSMTPERGVVVEGWPAQLPRQKILSLYLLLRKKQELTVAQSCGRTNIASWTRP